MQARPLWAVAVAGLGWLAVGCAADIDPLNVSDPDAPRELQAKSSLRGQVLLEARPSHAGARIEVLGTGLSVESDSEGHFAFQEVLTAGAYDIAVTREGFTPRRIDDVTVPIGATAELGLVTLFAQRTSVTGRIVLQNRNGELVPGQREGAVLVLRDVEGGAAYTALSDAAGEFTFEGVLGGELELSAELAGFVRREVVRVSVSGASAVRAEDLELLPESEVLVVSGGAAFTQRREVSVTVAGIEGADLMLLSESADFADVAPEPYSGESMRELSDGDGTKRVFAQLRRGERVVGEFSADVVLDRVAPGPVALRVDGGAGFSRDPAGLVSLEIAAADLTSGVGEMRVDVSHESGLSVPGTFEPFVPLLVRPLPRGEAGELLQGEWTLSVTVRDRAGNEAEAITESLVLDLDAPVPGSPALSVAAGAPVNTLDVFLDIDVTGATQMALSNEAGLPGARFQPLQPRVPWRLSEGADGPRRVFLIARDDAGNETPQLEATVTLDREAPGNPQLLIAGGAAFVTDPPNPEGHWNLSAEVSAEGASRFVLCTDPALGAVDCSSRGIGESPVTLRFRRRGLHTVYARIWDAAENASPVISAQIEIDDEAPRFLALSLPGGTVVSDRAIQIDIRSVGADRVCPESGLTLPTDCVDIPTGGELLLDAELTAGEGQKSIELRLEDSAGNQRRASFDGLFLDSVAPPPPTLTLHGRAAGGFSDVVTRAQTVVAEMSACDGVRTPGGCGAEGSGIEEFELTVGPDFSPTPFLPFEADGDTAVAPLPLTSDEGEQVVRLRVRDRAGNISESVEASIELDLTPPALPVVEIAGGDEYVRGSSVSVILSAEDADAYALCLRPDFAAPECAFNPGGDEVTLPAVDLQPGDGRRRIFARFRDAAGNLSATASDSVIVDSTPPGVPTVSVLGNTVEGVVYVNSVSVALAVTRGDDNDVIEMALSERMDFLGAAFQPFSRTATFLLGPAPGRPLGAERTLFVKLRDRAGNESPHGEVALVLDTTAPAAPRLLTRSGFVDHPPDTPFAVDFVRSSENTRNRLPEPVRYELKGGAYAAWTEVAVRVIDDGEPIPWWQVQGDIPSLVQDSSNLIGLRAVDLAGNVSAEELVVLEEDSSPPPRPVDFEADEGAGRITLRWRNGGTTPQERSDTVGYLVHYGIDSELLNGNFANEGPSPIDVGNLQQFTLTGIPDRSAFVVAVQAYDAVAQQGGLAPELLASHASEPSTSIQVISTALTPEIIGGRPGSGGFALGGAVRGTLLFVVNVHGGLQIFDISDPAQPELRGGYRIEDGVGPVTDVYAPAGEDYVVLTVRGDGVEVLDVSDPTSPTRIGLLENEGMTATSVGLGDRLYATVLGGVAAVDLSDPTQPQLLGPGVGGSAIAIAGNPVLQQLYAARPGALGVLDISDRDAPQPITRVPAGLLRRVAVDPLTNLVYVSTEDTVAAVNLQSGQVTPLLQRASVTDIAPTGSAIAVAREEGELLLYNPLPPHNLLGNLQVHLPIFGISVSQTPGGTTAFLHAGPYGTLVADVSDPTDATLLAEVASSGAFDVSVEYGRAWVAAGSDGVLVLDATDPQGPLITQRGSASASGPVWAVERYGRWLLAAAGLGGFVAFDLSDPDAPALQASIPVGAGGLPGPAVDVTIQNKHAYVACGPGGVVQVPLDTLAGAPSLSVSATLPLIRGPSQGGGTASGQRISAHRDRLAVATGDNLILFDLTQQPPERIPFLWSSRLRPTNTTLHGDIALFGSGDRAFACLDMSDPDNPLCENVFPSLSPSSDLNIAGRTIIATGYDEQAVRHVTDIAPIAYHGDSELGTGDVLGLVGGRGTGVRSAIDGNYSWVAKGGYGLEVQLASTPSIVSVVGVDPVPCLLHVIEQSGPEVFALENCGSSTVPVAQLRRKGLQALWGGTQSAIVPGATLAGIPWGLVEHEGYLYVTTGSELRVRSTTDIATDIAVTSLDDAGLPAPENLHSLVVSGGVLYGLEDSDSGYLRVMPIGADRVPRSSARIALPESGFHLRVDRDEAWISANSVVLRIDLSTETVALALPIQGGAADVEPRGEHIVVSTSAGEVSIHERDGGALLGSNNYGGVVLGVRVHGRYVFGQDLLFGPSIHDIGDLQAPQLISVGGLFFRSPLTHAPHVAADRMYLQEGLVFTYRME